MAGLAEKRSTVIVADSYLCVTIRSDDTKQTTMLAASNYLSDKDQ